MAEDRTGESRKASAADIIVAIGASGARIGALEQFLPRLTLPDGMAVVMVMQHREALDEERLRRALGEVGREVSPVQDDAPIEAGRIYLPDPDVIVSADHGRFRTRPAEQVPGERGTIDSFLVSLAQNEDGQSVAVLFDGTGGDGTLGFTAIKEAGGLTLAEETEEHRAGTLAASQSPAALADFLLSPDQLAERVSHHAQQLAEQKRLTSETDAQAISAALTSIGTILRNKTGHDFHGYKQGTFLRRVQRRMQVVQAHDIRHYVELLRSQPEEVIQLFNDLLIGVTQFFRDRKEFELLEREVIPKLFEGKTRTDQLRVWVIGCSTGEEAYSVAILLREHMAGIDDVPHVQIFGSDLDGRALASARVGRYTEAIVRDMSPERLDRWFVKEGNTYCIAKELREMCIFSQHSVIKDAPFSKLDLVSCRNLLIYLDTDLQSRVIPLFHFALKRSGFLFLGNSENVSRHTTLFAPIENRSRIFRRLETTTRTLPDFPFKAVDRRFVENAAPLARPRPMEGALARRAERIAERYAPAYVILDPSFDVLHFSGRTGRFLDPTGGAATLNFFNLIHPDLRVDLRAALAKAADENTTVEARNLLIRQNGYQLSVDLVVEPVQGNPAAAPGFVVLFRDGATVPAPADNGASGSLPIQSEHVQRLEAELRTTKDRLNATIEELESTNEELKSSNEEYQSLNEELQSANEELETSKEELQSVNEELTTVNGELAHRVQELGRTNSDLKNLLESTQIATIFLDNDLRVTNYTPAVGEVFHLVESDFGRPIAHIKSRVPYEELQEDVQRVLRTLGSVERQVQDPASGTRYMVRVLPYRSVDNFIRGAVITFTDVTPLTRAQEALRDSERQSKLLLAELQHRVRNTLAVVRSIARRTAATSETVEDYAMHLDGRLDAFARVQAAVTRNPSAGLDLEMLVAEELVAVGAHEGERVTSLKGPKIRLQPKTAETLALAIHELATNAVKYGALSTARGRIKVDWSVEEADGAARLVFTWVERGVTLAGQEPRRHGFGSELIEQRLAYELDGEASLHFEPEGLQCTISLPIGDGLTVEPI